MSFKKHLYFSLSFFSLFFLLSFISCKTIKQPSQVYVPLDYTDEDVIENEINVIRGLKENKSTLALFRACLVSQNNTESEIVRECAALVKEQADKAFEEGDYCTAARDYKSLVSCGIEASENTLLYEKCATAFTDDVPGLKVDKEKLPATIEDCLKASVTVWVDQGYRFKMEPAMQTSLSAPVFLLTVADT